ncbi:WhiB family transcriptional regulator, partial [Mycolicibacterium holsaticum]|uniref:WhiB family transcriptional regulator n=1 Tax=Mycolicibacterium holsaticum TaxID=152142 RepID=UPI001F185819
LCADCPIRRECLAAALERQEPWGVWGGEIFERGTVIARKRPRSPRPGSGRAVRTSGWSPIPFRRRGSRPERGRG